MKNIHVLPTDKPSRLFEDDLQLYYSKDKNRIGSIVSNHHIYITSDEEIKVGDWCFYVNSIYKVLRISSNNRPIIKMSDGTFEISYYRKIILTTDQDLIADGVQAIDDEFLEWFVKNPSCERVVVNNLCYGYLGGFADAGYKIIIPKEEVKEEHKTQIDYSGFPKSTQEKVGYVETKKETLEEAAERYAVNRSSSDVFRKAHREDFINGAKWQQEQIGKSEFLQKLRATISDAEAIRLIFETFNK